MDVDETNIVASVANIQNVFETEQAIPESDAYRFSKLVTDFTTHGGTVDTTALDETNILEWFDTQMANMDDAGVPEEGRILYLTPAMDKLLKEADGMTRFMSVNPNNGTIYRNIHNLDDVEIVRVPSARFKTKYDFTTGFVPASTAKQINAILVHPSAVVARERYDYIKMFTPGSDSRTGSGYIYQNRKYQDLFVLAQRTAGIAVNTAS